MAGRVGVPQAALSLAETPHPGLHFVDASHRLARPTMADEFVRQTPLRSFAA
jgi:hypothetical protein